MSPRLPYKKRIAIAAGIAVLCMSTVVGAVVYLSFFPADQGTFAPLGQSTVNFPSAANHTASQAEYAGLALNVTSTGSLAQTWVLFLPCIAGETKEITNSTTGGQAIAVACLGSDAGPAGTYVTVPNGQANSTTVLSPDGVNYVSVGGGSGALDAAGLAGDLSCTAAGVCTVKGFQTNAVGAGAPNAGNVYVWNGSAFSPAAVNVGGGAGYVTGALPYNNGGTSTGTAPSEGQILIASSSSAYAPTTATGDFSCSATTPGLCSVGTISGTGAANSYQSNGYLAIDAGESCMNANGNTLSCNADYPKLATTDGGVNVLCQHGIGSGFFRVVKITVEAHNNTCLGSSDYQYCTFKVALTSQSDGGGAAMNPSVPVCTEGAPVFGGSGSSYGTPTLTLDAAAPATLYLNVQGVPDAGCVDGSVTWGAEWSSVITE